MSTIRPIDEELNSLHKQVEIFVEDDIDSALDGFSVTNSGSIMIPNGFTKPLMIQQRRHSTGFPSSPHQAFYSSSFTQSLYASMLPAAIPTTSVDEYNAYRLAVSAVTASPQYTTQDTYQR